MINKSKEIASEVESVSAENGKSQDDPNQRELGEDQPSIVGNNDGGDKSISPAARKKKSKRAKLKSALGAGSHDAGASSSNNSTSPASKLTPGMVEQLLEMNPSLQSEVAGMDKEKAVEKLQQLEVADLLTGMSISGKNQKDMASYKFWQTQPVPRFGDDALVVEEGPIKIIDPEQIAKEPQPLPQNYEWVTMDLTDEKELDEVYTLLKGHYVEDDDASFRLTYSASLLDWSLKSPGWRGEWHVGVRATQSRKLVAFISGVPVSLRVRSKVLKSIEINFLCIHKKLRSNRLAPALIKEVTRRCYLLGIYQAIYTGGVVLPKPVSSCRYFHRSLDWLKLYETGFSALPHNTTKARQVAKNRLPSITSTDGLRPMQAQDVGAVHSLLERYLKRFAMAPEYTQEEVQHWLFQDEKLSSERVIWTYVVEDPQSHKITDFFSFYCLESAVVGSSKYANIRAAYLFYYATESAFEKEEKWLKERLNALILDALILAKEFNFDVFNALTLMDNPLFLEAQKFGAGDGQLHYYLYNYRTKLIPGGVDAKNSVDDKKRGGVGVMML